MQSAAAPASPHTKPHFPVLDGLRGVAALCVVTFHFSEMVVWNYSQLLIGHGFLAVDFFFCLSGFVMGYAYNSRLRAMGLAAFLQARLIRLHPMVVFGATLGLIAFYLNPFGVTPGYSPGKMALLFAASILLVPWGAMAQRSHNLFSLNAPAWSLFWEYVANLLFALVLFRLRRRTLAALTLLAAVALCWAGHHAGNLSGGWSSRNFLDGGVRVAYSFLAGLLVFRLGWRPRTWLGFPGLAVLLVLALIMPYARGASVREAAVILLYFPLLVALGAGTVVHRATQRLCRLSGELSYPLYMTHYAVIWIWGDYAGSHHLATRGFARPVALGVLCTVIFAGLVSTFYDKPVRRYLSRAAHARGGLPAGAPPPSA